MKIALRQARNENEIARHLQEQLGIKIKIENHFAREVDGQRGWEYNGYQIIRTEEETEIKSIGRRSRQMKFNYTLWGWVSTGYSHWEPDDVDAIEICSFDSLLAAVLEIDKIEKMNKVESSMEAEFWAKQVKEQEEWAKEQEGCRRCGKDAGGCAYCSAACSVADGAVDPFSHEADLAYTASKEK